MRGAARTVTGGDERERLRSEAARPIVRLAPARPSSLPPLAVFGFARSGESSSSGAPVSGRSLYRAVSDDDSVVGNYNRSEKKKRFPAVPKKTGAGAQTLQPPAEPTANDAKNSDAGAGSAEEGRAPKPASGEAESSSAGEGIGDGGNDRPARQNGEDQVIKDASETTLEKNDPSKCRY